ncbi:MAG: DNA-binding protein WhiA [Clostridiales bacterium]|nr:DNA-binding protein WhiA [Clostridiales bacterium]
MSFSSKTKDELNALEIKNACCRKAFRAGLNISLDDSAESILPNELFFKCPSCRSTFLRGLFISYGSATNPERGYHLELSFSSKRAAKEVESFLSDIGLPPKMSIRKVTHILYYKDSSIIEDFFAYIGATKAVFILMNSKIIRELRNNANRVANCETNNIEKMVAASQKHISAIKQLQKAGALKLLPAELQETARLRMAYPQLSLSELGGMMDPPISKSGVNHRLSKIMNAVKNIQNISN